ncbi:hypothetical protein D3C71_1949320 [compost metagenome]
MRLPERLDIIDWRRNATRATTAQIDERLLLTGEQALRFGFRVAGDHIQGKDRVRLLQTRRCAEIAPVQRQGLVHCIRREVRGESERQTHGRRQPCTEQA